MGAASCSSSDRCCGSANPTPVYIDPTDAKASSVPAVVGKAPAPGSAVCADGRINEHMDAGKSPDKTDGDRLLGLDTGAMYEGQWRGEEKHGEGKLLFSDGSSYEGQFTSDRKHGIGRYTYSNGSASRCSRGGCSALAWHLVASLRCPRPRSEQIFTWLCRRRLFDGQFMNGDKHGKGKFTWSTGGTYEGNFSNNEMDGYGTYSWSDGRSYTGQWQQNSMGPRGLMRWTDGRQYDGEWLDGKKHGTGKLSWPDGRSYTGQWVAGRQHGWGVAVTAKGLSRNSQWDNGNFVQWLEGPPEITGAENQPMS